jgi:hypothetical protein
MGSSVHGEAGCIICCQPRVLKGLFPVAEGVELKLYECASCASNMWLITKVSRPSFPKRAKAKTQFTTIDAALEAAAFGARRLRV